MKKIILLLIILVLTLCSCESAETRDRSTTQTKEPSDTVLLLPMSFDSFSDLCQTASKTEKDSITDFFQEHGHTEETLARVTAFVASIQNQESCIPFFGEDVITLRDKEGYTNICLFASESFQLPWLFFYPKVSSDKNYYLKLTILPEEYLEGIENLTASELLSKLAPDYPNIGQLGDQQMSIENQTIHLQDREVVAMSIADKEDSRNSLWFLYGKLLVEVRCDVQEWNEDWFSNLSFQPIGQS
ncbi:MAG: hypothetical protein II710_01905 [Clostridia bacterium]|nr:hypothetical protein [Clostridia bacterium]